MQASTYSQFPESTGGQGERPRGAWDRSDPLSHGFVREGRPLLPDSRALQRTPPHRSPGGRNTVVITCSEAQAEELLRLAQVSCRAAMQDIKTALAEAREGKRKP